MLPPPFFYLPYLVNYLYFVESERHTDFTQWKGRG